MLALTMIGLLLSTIQGSAQSIYTAYIFANFVGAPSGRGSADGTGSVARFNETESVAVDSSGNVYVADTANNTIRMITSAGVVTTFAGSAGSVPPGRAVR